MREQTEWIELVMVGANELIGADTNKIIAATCNVGFATNSRCMAAAKRIVNEFFYRV